MAAVEANELVALDANFLVAALAAGSSYSRQLDIWLQPGAVVQISAVAWSEYLCGPLQPDKIPVARKLVNSVEPFTEDDANLASELFNQTGRRSRSHVDCMIAAHAIRRNATLATLNRHDFRRFEKFHLKLALPS